MAFLDTYAYQYRVEGSDPPWVVETSSSQVANLHSFKDLGFNRLTVDGINPNTHVLQIPPVKAPILSYRSTSSGQDGAKTSSFSLATGPNVSSSGGRRPSWNVDASEATDRRVSRGSLANVALPPDAAA